MARASAVLGAPLQDADQLRVFLSTGNSRDFSDHNGQL